MNEEFSLLRAGKYVGTVHTKCPECGFSYQRPVTAKEMIRGGGVKEVACELCSKRCKVHFEC